ncbi:MAG: hypothetical protein GX180_11650 [Enterococcus sp.]|nr:hypothetical protein [Enterococcus sp.]
MPQNHTIEITETLQKQVTVQAASKEEALAKVEQMYQDEIIVLAAEDLFSQTIQLVSNEIT